MINEVPGVTPSTTPPRPSDPPEVTVATPGLALDQVPNLVASVKWIVSPTQTEVGPTIAPTAGNGLTVIVLSDVAAPHEFGSLVVNLNITGPE